MSAQNVMHDSSLVSGTELFNTCLKCFLRTVCSFAVLTQCMSHEMKVAESFMGGGNLAPTVLAREEICKITCFPGLRLLGWLCLGETQSLWT